MLKATADIAVRGRLRFLAIVLVWRKGGSCIQDSLDALLFGADLPLVLERSARCRCGRDARMIMVGVQDIDKPKRPAINFAYHGPERAVAFFTAACDLWGR